MTRSTLPSHSSHLAAPTKKRSFRHSFKMLWNILKICLVGGLFIILLNLESALSISIDDMEATLPLGVFILLVALVIGISVCVWSFLRGVFGLKGAFVRRRQNKRQVRANASFQSGMFSFLVRDFSQSHTQLKTCSKYSVYPPITYAAHILQHLSAFRTSHTGHKHEALHFFKALQSYKDTALVATFGLMESARSEVSYNASAEEKYNLAMRILGLLEHAQKHDPHHQWVLNTKLNYTLNALKYGTTPSLSMVEQAMDTLHLCQSHRAVDKAPYKKYLGEILWHKARFYIDKNDIDHAKPFAWQAFENNGTLTDAACFLSAHDTPKRARDVLTESFSKRPHADTLNAFLALDVPALELFQHVEKVYTSLAPDTGQKALYWWRMLLVKLALKAKLWGRAKHLFSEISLSKEYVELSMLEKQVAMCDQSHALLAT